MSSGTPPAIEPADDPDVTVVEFFAEVERKGGPKLSRRDHDAIVAAIRADREG